ncbi:unnamed protein product [Phytomonas sp. Hart1]|nr:unnamed protein product [Phytomonas sp. Hart1]|eukprot:CCW69959.1 unnamed protein product [Phytomonas sp. isolate Hart1]
MFRRTTFSLKPNVVIVGTGWAACYTAHRLNPSICNIQVLSTRNHMVFTPLLAHTTTGTLEFRAVCEPITNIQPALVNLPHRFYRCMVYDVDFDANIVKCVGLGVPGTTEKLPVHTFNVKYDYLLLAHGSRPNTFNTPGVTDKAFFLREVNEARGIRKRLVQNIMAADLPTVPIEETKRLLHTVVVGGGPTGIEFATNLAEFFRKDIVRLNRHLQKYCKVTVLEANEVLGTFDQTLRNYGHRRLAELGINIVNTAVVEVTERGVVTTSGETLESGLVVWSTGVGPTMLTLSLQCDKTKQQRISVDENLRVLRDGKAIPNVFAAGDSAANVTAPLPTLAAVARRQGAYLGKQLNHLITKKTMTQSFEYKDLGSMVALGDASAIVSLGSKRKIGIQGLKALWVWKSAYLSMIGSFRNKLYIFINWCGSHLFSRDITYIGDLSEDRLYKILAGHEMSRTKNRPQATEVLKGMTATQTFTPELLEKAVSNGYITQDDIREMNISPADMANKKT